MQSNFATNANRFHGTFAQGVTQIRLGDPRDSRRRGGIELKMRIRRSREARTERKSQGTIDFTRTVPQEKVEAQNENPPPSQPTSKREQSPDSTAAKRGDLLQCSKGEGNMGPCSGAANNGLAARVAMSSREPSPLPVLWLVRTLSVSFAMMSTRDRGICSRKPCETICRRQTLFDRGLSMLR